MIAIWLPCIEVAEVLPLICTHTISKSIKPIIDSVNEKKRKGKKASTTPQTENRSNLTHIFEKEAIEMSKRAQVFPQTARSPPSIRDEEISVYR